MDPLLGCSHPTERKQIINPAANALGPLPDQRQIRNQSHVEENDTHGEVGAHGKDVPDQGRAEIDPKQPLMRIRHQPIEKPRAAEMYERIKPCREHGEDRHRFGEAVEAAAELGANKEEYR